MGWDEVRRLKDVLAADPSSQVCASLSGWQGPFSHEAFVLADLYDVVLRRWAKGKPQPRNRPTDPKPKTLGRAGQDQSKVLAALRRRGHKRRSGR